MNGRVLVVGDAAADLTIWRNGDVPATNAPIRMTRGGTAANTAVGLARQGASVAFVAAVGEDRLGQLVRDDLAQEGVDITHLKMLPGTATPQVMYAIDDDGSIWSNSIWPPLEESAILQLAPGHVDPTMVGGFAWMHVVGVCLLGAPLRETTSLLMRTAHEAGVPVSLDLNLRTMERVETEAFKGALAQVLPYATHLLGSAGQEFGYLFPDDPPETTARRIAQNGQTVVLRMAEAGAMAVTPTETVRVDALSVKVVSAVGAGDAFNAGFIVAAVQGSDVEGALRRGGVTAALTISRADAGCPTAAMVSEALTASVEERPG